MLDNTMPLEKIPAILLVGYGIQVSLTSLTPATPKNERRMENAPVEPNWFANFLKVSNFGASQTHQLTSIKAVSRICTIIEICIILAGTKTTWSKGFMTLSLPNGKCPDCIKLTPTTTFATALVLLGTAIQYWCYREIGRYFICHVTLPKNHKLITTGPYSVVCHSSYTGMVLMLVGEVIWYTPRGSWLRESIVYQMKLSWLLIASICFLSYL